MDEFTENAIVRGLFDIHKDTQEILRLLREADEEEEEEE